MAFYMNGMFFNAYEMFYSVVSIFIYTVFSLSVQLMVKTNQGNHGYGKYRNPWHLDKIYLSC